MKQLDPEDEKALSYIHFKNFFKPRGVYSERSSILMLPILFWSSLKLRHRMVEIAVSINEKLDTRRFLTT
jgi:hypothetical protein